MAERFDPAGRVERKDFVVRPLKYRPIRPHSIEFEFNGERDWLLREFAYERLDIFDDYDRREQTPRNMRWASMGDDCTVDGGELRFNKLNFSSKKDMDKMHKATSIIMQGIEEGRIDVEDNCGFHNHIDMHGFTEDEGMKLLDIWNYIEDPIFQIASALTPGPRGECGPLPKRGFTCSTATRGYGLNLDNFYFNELQPRNYYGHTSTDRITAEFRVFNGCANMRKTLAYVSLCQSMLSLAKLHARNDITLDDPFEVDNPDWREDDDYDRYCENCRDYYDYCGCTPPEPVEAKPWIETTKDRLTWMFRTLPMTKADKANLAYCVKNAPGYERTGILDESFIDGLVATSSKRWNQEPVEADTTVFDSRLY